jgi:uncharacterized protein (DUF934 family)
MPDRLIIDSKIVDNQWQLIAADTDTFDQHSPLIVPLSLWAEQRESLLQRPRLGVWLDCDQSPQLIAEDLSHFEVIAIQFTNFADGRGFSYGRELRDTHGYQGEVRAIGSFIRDQLFFLQRCGFNAFALETADLQASLASLSDFSESYQAAMDQPAPLYNRR